MKGDCNAQRIVSKQANDEITANCRKVKLGKALCNLAPLIGQSYGIQFEVPADGEDIEFKKPRRASLPQPMQPLKACYCTVTCHGPSEFPHACRLSEGVASEWQQWDADGTMGKNNSQLVDGGDAVQALSPVEIEAMKEAGVGGAAILDALMANSSTYDSKTQFAQVRAPCWPQKSPLFVSRCCAHASGLRHSACGAKKAVCSA